MGITRKRRSIFSIAANLGHDDSLENLKRFYGRGLISKEEFASVLRGHKAAVDATKSRQRDEAEVYREKYGHFFHG